MSCRRVTRRQLLALSATAVTGLAGCSNLRTRDSESRTTGRKTSVRQTSERPPGFVVENGRLRLRLLPNEGTGVVGCHELSPVGAPVRFRPVATRPKTPLSRTESAGPKSKTIVNAKSLDSPGKPSGYTLSKRVLLDQTPVRIVWTVRLPSGQRFAIFDVRIENEGSTRIRLDQDRGDTHDGIQLLTRFGLDQSRPGVDAAGRFRLQRTDTKWFDNMIRWKTFPNTRLATVFDDVSCSTLVYLRGDTAPKMVVVNNGTLDYLVNECRLSPGGSVGYRVGIYSHVRTDESDEPAIRQAAQRVRQWERANLPKRVG